jgi:hypothetical protein
MFEYAEYIEEDTSLKWSLDCVPDSYRKGVLSIPKMFRCDLSKESLIQLLNDFSVFVDDDSNNSSTYGFFLGCRDGIAYWLLNGKPLNDDGFSISSFSSLFINSLCFRKG